VLGRGNYSRHFPRTSQRGSGSPLTEKALRSGQATLPTKVLTNDESTWTNPVPATEDDEFLLSHHYVPALCSSFVYEREGGKMEVRLSDSEGSSRFIADNVLPNGRLVENKSGAVGTKVQFRWYLRYLDEHGGSLEYNFFRSPVSGKVGPSPQFATMLKKASRKYKIDIHFFDNDWWEELQ
jgi:hypothetical protein